ncbi:MAG TPA: hypothetical protein VM712_16460, partial [Gaiellales bacterium]|nr:hypothetical protein [Gaiellales bacterium]
TQANASKHLGLLADGGLLSRRREGLRCYYAIADHAVFTLCDQVTASVLSHLDQRTELLRGSRSGLPAPARPPRSAV